MFYCHGELVRVSEYSLVVVASRPREVIGRKRVRMRCPLGLVQGPFSLGGASWRALGSIGCPFWIPMARVGVPWAALVVPFGSPWRPFGHKVSSRSSIWRRFGHKVSSRSLWLSRLCRWRSQGPAVTGDSETESTFADGACEADEIAYDDGERP